MENENVVTINGVSMHPNPMPEVSTRGMSTAKETAIWLRNLKDRRHWDAHLRVERLKAARDVNVTIVFFDYSFDTGPLTFSVTVGTFGSSAPEQVRIIHERAAKVYETVLRIFDRWIDDNVKNS